MLLVQLGTVFVPPAGQSADVQQPDGLMQVLLFKQYFCPPVHFPPQGALCTMHVPSQFWGVLVGQFGTQEVPSQLTLPPTGFLQALVHSVGPQVSRA
jgi:hypothetical protein